MKGRRATIMMVNTLVLSVATPAVYALGPEIDFEKKICMFSDVNGRSVGSTAVVIELSKQPLFSIPSIRATSYEARCKFLLPIRDSQPRYSAPEGISCQVNTGDGVCEDSKWTQEVSPIGRVTLHCECKIIVPILPPPVPGPLER